VKTGVGAAAKIATARQKDVQKKKKKKKNGTDAALTTVEEQGGQVEEASASAKQKKKDTEPKAINKRIAGVIRSHFVKKAPSVNTPDDETDGVETMVPWIGNFDSKSKMRALIDSVKKACNLNDDNTVVNQKTLLRQYTKLSNIIAPGQAVGFGGTKKAPTARHVVRRDKPTVSERQLSMERRRLAEEEIARKKEQEEEACKTLTAESSVLTTEVERIVEVERLAVEAAVRDEDAEVILDLAGVSHGLFNKLVSVKARMGLHFTDQNSNSEALQREYIRLSEAMKSIAALNRAHGWASSYLRSLQSKPVDRVKTLTQSSSSASSASSSSASTSGAAGDVVESKKKVSRTSTTSVEGVQKIGLSDTMTMTGLKKPKSLRLSLKQKKTSRFVPFPGRLRATRCRDLSADRCYSWPCRYSLEARPAMQW